MSTAVVTPAPQTETLRDALFKNATLLAVSREWPPLTKALPKSFITVENADKSRLHGNKDLYNSTPLKRLQNLEMSLDSRLKSYSSAPFPLKNGIFIVGKDLYYEIEDLFAHHIERREPLIDSFVNEYDAEIIKAQQHLGTAFDPSDYTTSDRVRRMFVFRWLYLSMDVAANLAQVDQAVLARESDKLTSVWDEAGNSIRQLMRAQMKLMVDGLVDRLSSQADGKRKIFRNTVLDPINEFVRLFDARNLASDTELKTLVSQAQQLVNGISPEDLRTNDALRNSIQAGFASVKTTLDTLVIEAPEREIILED